MQYNVNNPSIKRILREVKEMEAEPSNQYTAAPLEENLFEWHFTIRGPVGTEFEGGLYHGRIILPPEYPFKPPNIVLLNPSGRFEVGTKICLSISSYHPEHWQPSWSIRTVLVALISFMPTKGEGAIGAIDYPPEERRKLAAKSIDFMCEKCGARMCDVFPPDSNPPASESENPSPDNTTSTTTVTPASATTITTTITTSEDTTPASRTFENTNNNNNANNSNSNNNVYNTSNNVIPQQHQQHVENIAYIPQALPQVPAANLPNVAPVMHAPAQVAAVQLHDGVSGDPPTQTLDYIIVAIAVAILALVIRKLYYSTEAI